MRIRREMAAAIVCVLIAVAAASVTRAAIVANAPAGQAKMGAKAKETKIPGALAPVARDTRGNLQDAFQNEVNTKARYMAAAAIADREGYPYVARLFRACAQSEQIHADQDVHAIAWMGDAAKAFLEPMQLGTTAENLRAAIDRETYEATQWDPMLVARARADHQPAAVRSLTYAMASEREHAKWFTAALARMEQRPPARPFYVCSVCGMTVSALDFKSCPSCFAPVRKFRPVE